MGSGLCLLLRLNPGAQRRGKHHTIQFSWVAVWLLVTCASLVYLIDELDLVFIVLFKEVRMLRWCESQGISYWAELNLESSQAFMMELCL